MNVLISGARNMPEKWREFMRQQLALLPVGTVIVHGGAKGADTMAGEIAEELGFEVIVERANWKDLGKAAGPERNQRMLSKYKPGLALFFHDDPTLGTGTCDMYKRCCQARVVCRICLYPS